MDGKTMGVQCVRVTRWKWTYWSALCSYMFLKSGLCVERGGEREGAGRSRASHSSHYSCSLFHWICALYEWSHLSKKKHLNKLRSCMSIWRDFLYCIFYVLNVWENLWLADVFMILAGYCWTMESILYRLELES